jgi:hypothetical protein
MKNSIPAYFATASLFIEAVFGRCALTRRWTFLIRGPKAMSKIHLILALIMFLTGLPVQAQAPDENFALNDRFRIYLGGFWANVDSEITINGQNQSPPPISVESVLGIEDSKGVLWGGARWRISRRNQLEFEFFQLDRDGVQGFTNANLGVGDYIVDTGSIDTALDVRVGRLTYGFSLFRNDQMDIQLKAGLHIADLSMALQLMGNVCDTTIGEMPPCPLIESPVVESEDITAPLPHLGGSLGYAFTPNVTARFQVIGFAIELDNIDGSIVEVDADINWNPWRHFGVGAGIRYFNFDFKGRGSELNGEFEYEYWGPVIYVETTF